MKYKLTRNLGLKLLSVLAACLIWLVVTNNNDPEGTQVYKNVPITIKNQETITNANKTFTVQDGIDKINVYYTGRKSVRNKLNSSSFTVTADLEKYNEALGSVPLEISCNNARVSQESLRLIPSSISINMEDKVEESFSIAASVTGTAKKGKELGRTSIVSGDTIKIAGPESLIRIIGKVTVAVDITNMENGDISHYPVRIEDKNGSQLTESQMSNLELKNSEGVLLQNNEVEVDVEIWDIYYEVPINIQLMGEPADDRRVESVSVTPKTVNLVATPEAMEALGEELTLIDTLSVQGMSESGEFTFDLENTLAQYEDIRLESDISSTVTVQVAIAHKGSKVVQIPISSIKMKNVPKYKKLIFSPADYLSVTVRTTDGDIRDIDESDIKASVDLKSCEVNGNFTLPVMITLPEGYEVEGETTIVVNIDDAENEAEAEAETEG
ncbi:MAG: YbbR-like domain-containing protein [Muricoprocola sp.]